MWTLCETFCDSNTSPHVSPFSILSLPSSLYYCLSFWLMLFFLTNLPQVCIALPFALQTKERREEIHRWIQKKESSSHSLIILQCEIDTAKIPFKKWYKGKQKSNRFFLYYPISFPLSIGSAGQISIWISSFSPPSPFHCTNQSNLPYLYIIVQIISIICIFHLRISFYISLSAFFPTQFIRLRILNSSTNFHAFLSSIQLPLYCWKGSIRKTLILKLVTNSKWSLASQSQFRRVYSYFFFEIGLILQENKITSAWCQLWKESSYWARSSMFVYFLREAIIPI